MTERWAGSILHVATLFAALFWLASGVADPPAPPPRSFLGIEFGPLTAAAQARAPYLTNGGALVLKVVRGSPAEAAGFIPGAVVTAIDGQAISSAEDAVDALESAKAGHTVSISIYDAANTITHERRLGALLAARPPENRSVFTVEPPRALARQWDFRPSMAAHAAWSQAIARGAVNPMSLSVLVRGRCSAVAPEDWRIADASLDGTSFALISQRLGARAAFAIVPMAKDETPETAVGRVIAKFMHISPELSSSENARFGFRVIDYGSSGGYAGFALYRIIRHGRSGPIVSVRSVAVPASDVAELAPLAGAVALSIRCKGLLTGAPKPFDDALAPTSVSVRCLHDGCDESDFAGGYNEDMHTGYVHAQDGGNFLIDPRKDIWATGPNGPGTYRQVSGTLEKLEPGRTN
jgi:hypothetical protein